MPYAHREEGYHRYNPDAPEGTRYRETHSSDLELDLADLALASALIGAGLQKIAKLYGNEGCKTAILAEGLTERLSELYDGGAVADLLEIERRLFVDLCDAIDSYASNARPDDHVFSVTPPRFLKIAGVQYVRADSLGGAL